MPVSLNAVSMKAKGMLSPSTCYQFEDPTFGTTGSSLSSITPYFIYSSRSSSLTLDEFQKLTELQAVKTSVLIGSEISVCKASYHYVSNFVGCRASSSPARKSQQTISRSIITTERICYCSVVRSDYEFCWDFQTTGRKSR